MTWLRGLASSFGMNPASTERCRIWNAFDLEPLASITEADARVKLTSGSFEAYKSTALMVAITAASFFTEGDPVDVGNARPFADGVAPEVGKAKPDVGRARPDVVGSVRPEVGNARPEVVGNARPEVRAAGAGAAAAAISAAAFAICAVSSSLSLFAISSASAST